MPRSAIAANSRTLLFTFCALRNHRQNRTVLRLFLRPRSSAGLRRTADDVSDRGTFQYLRRCIPHLEENTIERAMVGIGDHEVPQLIRIPERRQWTVHQSNDLAQFNFPRRAPQSVAALRTAHA